MMLLGNSARFTRHEVEESRQVGVDLGNVTHQKDIEQEVSQWVRTLVDERYDLLGKDRFGDGEVEGSEPASKLSAVCGETEIEHGPSSVPQFRETPRQ